MSAPAQIWKKWEGQVVEGKFPLQQWLGGSDHSAVFLTKAMGGTQKAAIKIVAAGAPGRGVNHSDSDQASPDRSNPGHPNPDQANTDRANVQWQLARWAEAARLSHPHLLRLLEWGECQIDGERLPYVVMEYADENLAEVLPVRALTAEEAGQMLGPVVEGLVAVHRAGFVHGRVKPANIMAVGNQLKISTDGLSKAGERGIASSPYNAPEVASTGLSAAADVWSVGATLLASLAKTEPMLKPGQGLAVAVPDTIPQPFRDIARRCLQVDPQQRCTVEEIIRRQSGDVRAGASQTPVEAGSPQARPKRWNIGAIAVVVFLVVLAASKFLARRPAMTNQNPPAVTQTLTEVPATQSPAPFTPSEKPASRGTTPGSVLQQVAPDVSRSALNTIQGRVKVNVQVEVDAAGNVASAKLTSAGPSRYFAERALAAARKWRFTPAQVDGKAAGSEWVLHFQFRRTSAEVVPAEIRP